MTLGMWLFIASEVMLFGGLFSAYVLIRSGAADWGIQGDLLTLAKGLSLTGPLLLTAVALRRGDRSSLFVAALLALTFVLLKLAGYAEMTRAGLLPSRSTFLALYYLLTGVHAVHVALGMLVAGYLAIRGAASTDGDQARFDSRVRALALYWYFVDIVWICIFAAFYLS